jgi:hypothetical protein
MLIVDAGALKFAVDLAKPVVAESLSAAPGEAVSIPPQLSEQLNAMLANAMLEDLLALRERERSVSLETLRMTVR